VIGILENILNHHTSAKNLESAISSLTKLSWAELLKKLNQKIARKKSWRKSWRKKSVKKLKKNNQ
jgi:hypothetical protein